MAAWSRRPIHLFAGQKTRRPRRKGGSGQHVQVAKLIVTTIQNNKITAGQRFPHSKVALDASATVVAAGQQKSPEAAYRPGSLAQLW